MNTETVTYNFGSAGYASQNSPARLAEQQRNRRGEAGSALNLAKADPAMYSRCACDG
jgi:hypothetical protein